MAKNKFETDIVLGVLYRDTQTGLEGTASSIHFFQHACERVCLEYINDDKDLKEAYFDAGRLERVETGKVAKVEKPGGPERGDSRARASLARR